MAISAAKLEQAMEGLREAWRGSEDDQWEDVRVLQSYGTKYLRVARTCKPRDSGDACDPESRPEEELKDENDAEVLPSAHSRRPVDSGARVHYDVVHSPSYQVPVLYLTFPGRGLPPPDEVYELVIPASQQQQVDAVGVMGAMSLTEHPVTGLPAYFVHPCRTQEAMLAVTDGREVSPEKYLVLWLGVIGSSVSLSLPVEVASRRAIVWELEAS